MTSTISIRNWLIGTVIAASGAIVFTMLPIGHATETGAPVSSVIEVQRGDRTFSFHCPSAEIRAQCLQAARSVLPSTASLAID